MGNVPSITIAIIAHDRETYIREALASALSCDRGSDNFEILVLTNFPSPTSKVGVSSLAFPTNVVRHVVVDAATVGEGLVRAASLAEGDYIAFLDDDDLFLPEKVKHLEDVLRVNTGLDYYHHRFVFFGELNKASQSFPSPVRVDRLETDAALKFLCHGPFEQNMSSTVVRRQFVLSKSDFLAHFEGLIETDLLMAVVASRASALFDPVVLTRVRRHPMNTSRLSFDVARRNRAWASLLATVNSLSPDSPARVLYRVRRSQSILYDSVAGAIHSNPDIRRAIGTILASASFSGARRTLQYTFLSMLAMLPLPFRRVVAAATFR